MAETQAPRRRAATKPLPPELRTELQRRVDASSARAVGRALGIGHPTVGVALRGECLTPLVRNYLALMLAPSAPSNPQPAAHCVA